MSQSQTTDQPKALQAQQEKRHRTLTATRQRTLTATRQRKLTATRQRKLTATRQQEKNNKSNQLSLSQRDDCKTSKSKSTGLQKRTKHKTRTGNEQLINNNRTTILSLVYMHNLNPGANLLPGAKLHPGVNLHSLM